MLSRLFVVLTIGFLTTVGAAVAFFGLLMPYLFVAVGIVPGRSGCAIAGRLYGADRRERIRHRRATQCGVDGFTHVIEVDPWS